MVESKEQTQYSQESDSDSSGGSDLKSDYIHFERSGKKKIASMCVMLAQNSAASDQQCMKSIGQTIKNMFDMDVSFCQLGQNEIQLEETMECANLMQILFNHKQWANSDIHSISLYEITDAKIWDNKKQLQGAAYKKVAWVNFTTYKCTCKYEQGNCLRHALVLHEVFHCLFGKNHCKTHKISGQKCLMQGGRRKTTNLCKRCTDLVSLLRKKV